MRRALHRVAAATAATALMALAGAATSAPHAVSAAGKYPPIKHVFVVMLENEGFDAAFQANPNPFLPSLASKGALLGQYYGIAHQSLPNYIALIGGQTPTHETQADCPDYTDLTPASRGFAGWAGQDGGDGCVYPADRTTLANQLDTLHLTWKGYMEDLGFDAGRDGPMTCSAPGTTGRQDTTQSAEAPSSNNGSRGDQYAARHDPFMYFHAIIDRPECATNVVTLQDPARGLLHDLQSTSTTPNLSFITPNLCDDGHDPSSTSPSTQCAAPDVAGSTAGGLKSVDDWLSAYVPRILASPAYQQDGMLVIAFDEADTTKDFSSCCNEYNGPNTQSPGIQTSTDGGVSGGGKVGAIVLSRYVKPGTVSQQPYNHFGLLRTLEDLFGCTGGDDGAGHLGAAADYNQRPGPSPFGADVFTNPSGAVAQPVAALAGGITLGGSPMGAGGGAGWPATAVAPAYPALAAGGGSGSDSGNAVSGPTPAGSSVLPARAFRPTGVAPPDSAFPAGMALVVILLPLFAAGAAGFLVARQH